MENLLYFIPLFTCIFCFFLFRKKFAAWEYAVIIFGTCGITLVTMLIMKEINCSDVEYRGDYVTRIEHYEPWNEWVHRTCTRTIKVGKTTTTQHYDCSYCRHHPEEWLMVTSLKKKYNISKDDYLRVSKLWGGKEIFVNMNRDFHTLDGDMYFTKWDYNENTIIPITTEKEYSNKVIGSKSVFNFEYISKKEADSLKLYDYPEITNHNYPFPQRTKTFQNAVIGYNNKEFSKKINYINAIHGPKNHIRTYILFFNNRDRDIAHKQISYWDGGNFNEHIICLGLNTTNNIIEWVETYSWEDTPYLAVETKQWFTVNNHIDSLNRFPIWYNNVLNSRTKWACKNAEDFDYLKTDLTNGQLIALLIISIIVAIGISVYGYFNEFDAEIEHY